MSEAISMLERLGQQAGLRHVAADGVDSASATREVAPALRGALTSTDSAELEALLGAKINLVCGLFPGREDEETPAEESPDKDDAPPAEDSEKIGRLHRGSAIASAR